MALILRAVSLDDQPLTPPITARFDREGGTVGRAGHNTMALPDPQCHISRRQAEIRPGPVGYVIRNIGSANCIAVRNRLLAQWESGPLAHRDEVRIGGYLLEVVDDAAHAADATIITRGGAAAGAAAVPALAVHEPVERAAAAGRLCRDRLALFGGPAYAAPPGSAADRTPQPHRASVPMRAPGRAGTPPPELRDAPHLREAPAAASSATHGDVAAAWAAFCEGAGVRVDTTAGATPDTMRAVGQLLRAAVEGTVQLIAVRSTTRHELHAEVTVIRPRDNNPLKFSPDGQSALEQMLQPPLRGFLPGPAAMKDAMNDLVGHAIGAMAGTRAALEGVLERFAPGPLEAKLADKTMLDSVLPMNRKAKLWELYLQHYERIRDDAQDDFHALFGRAFLAAYEEQLERLRSAPR